MLTQSANNIAWLCIIFLGLSNPQNTNIYDEIPEYEELKENKVEKRYENNDVVDKMYVSLKPLVMETIRDHMQNAVSLLCQIDKISSPILVYV